MKLPKNYFENLSIAKYRAYLKLLPPTKRENTKAVTMLIFTFLALSFLAIFAINPTLSTIIELQKQYEDSQFVHEQLTTKMNNLSSLQQQYNTLSDDLVFVYDALPQNASVPTLVGQLSALAEESSIEIKGIRISPVILSDVKAKQSIKTHSSFSFTLEAEGEYESMMNFAASLTNFNRLVTIETISMTKNQVNNNMLLTVEGREYFKK
jgi:Tfp pilus assembly protein PilO